MIREISMPQLLDYNYFLYLNTIDYGNIIVYNAPNYVCAKLNIKQAKALKGVE